MQIPLGHNSSYVPAEDVDALLAKKERYAAMPAVYREGLGARGHDWLLKNLKYEALAQDYLYLLCLLHVRKYINKDVSV